MTETPYDTIADEIERWCQNNYYADMLVCISVDGEIITDILELNLVGPLSDFTWLHDWWEGEKDVKLVGFRPIDQIIVYGNPTKTREPI